MDAPPSPSLLNDFPIEDLRDNPIVTVPPEEDPLNEWTNIRRILRELDPVNQLGTALTPRQIAQARIVFAMARENDEGGFRGYTQARRRYQGRPFQISIATLLAYFIYYGEQEGLDPSILYRLSISRGGELLLFNVYKLINDPDMIEYLKAILATVLTVNYDLNVWQNERDQTVVMVPDIYEGGTIGVFKYAEHLGSDVYIPPDGRCTYDIIRHMNNVNVTDIPEEAIPVDLLRVDIIALMTLMKGVPFKLNKAMAFKKHGVEQVWYTILDGKKVRCLTELDEDAWYVEGIKATCYDNKISVYPGLFNQYKKAIP